MDTEHVKTFIEIVREGSFSRAARNLDLAQPTVSGRIQALEQEVGGALLVRGGARVRLTDLGESFLPFARRALETLQEGVEATRAAQGGQRGILRVGPFTSVATTLLPGVLTHFQRTYPGIDLRIRDGYHEEVVRLLQDGLVELGHVLWPWPLTPAEVVPLVHFREPLVFVASPQNPLIRKGSVTTAELIASGEPFYHLGSGQQWTKIIAAIRAAGRGNIDAPLATAYELTLNGTGVALFTRSLVHRDLQAGRLVELTVSDAAPDYRGVALVRYVFRDRLSAMAVNFVKTFEEEARRAPWVTMVTGQVEM
jgi:DNA-binding transcriptional LysR family regulator